MSRDVRDDHLGVDRQQRLCRDLAEQRGLTVADVLVDNDISAYRRKPRPQFERLVKLLRAGDVDAVLTYHADRLYRRTTDLERLVDVVETTGAQVHTVAAGDVDLGTASGRMVARMLGAAAQHESERLGERVRVKADELAALGRAPGGRPPYGYKRGMMPNGVSGYVINPEEAAVLRSISERILEGRSLLRISRELTAEGIPTREGRAWHNASVRAAIINPAIAGLRVHRREIVGTGDWEPIFNRAEWEEIRAVVADPARKRRRPARKYLLSGMIETINGDSMVGRPSYDRETREPIGRIYTTPLPASLALQVNADDVEALVVEATLQRLDHAAIPAATEERPSGAGAEVEALEAELEELAKLRGDGAITMGEWLTARGRLQERLEDARGRASRTRRPPAAERLLAKPGAVRAAWPTLDFGQRREILSAIVDKVVILPASRARWTPIEERVDVRWRA